MGIVIASVLGGLRARSRSDKNSAHLFVSHLAKAGYVTRIKIIVLYKSLDASTKLNVELDVGFIHPSRVIRRSPLSAQRRFNSRPHYWYVNY